MLGSLKDEPRTIILYAAPHDLKKTLQELCETLGERQIAICRELTKRFEEVRRTTLAEAEMYYNTHEPKGEYVLVIEGKSFSQLEKETQSVWQQMPLDMHMAHYEAQGMDKKSAMKQVAKDRGISKREVYQSLLDAEKD